MNNVNTSKDADTSFESVSSLTQSDGSPEPKAVEDCSDKKVDFRDVILCQTLLLLQFFTYNLLVVNQRSERP